VLPNMAQNWNQYYEQYGPMTPQEDMPRVVGLFKERGIRKVLDLGCGSGRHLVYLAGQGFEVFGIDIAEKANELAASWLKEKELRAEVSIGSIFERLPYEDDFFDAIVTTKVINHGRIEDIRKAIKEIERVLKPKGLIFIEVSKGRKARDSKKQRSRSEIIDPRTIVLMTGKEKGIIHYLFNKAILLKELRNFKIFDFWVDSQANYCLLGEQYQVSEHK